MKLVNSYKPLLNSLAHRYFKKLTYSFTKVNSQANFSKCLDLRIFKWSSLIILFLLFACKKPEDRKCYKSTGENSVRIVYLADFNKLVLKKKLKYVLVQNDSSYLKIIGGENMLNLVSYELNEEGSLEVFNENKCNFLRDLKESITVEIHFKDLSEIQFEGSETLDCPDTLNLNNLKFVILDACGTMNLKINANSVDGEVAYGWGDYTILGQVQNAQLGVRSNGYCNIENLRVLGDFKLKNESVGNMYINATNSNLSGHISGKGNIFYKGLPLTNTVSMLGEGKMIAN
ncbi:MAG: DUF2807 domain-containing protein [Bacteroidota bacterium]